MSSSQQYSRNGSYSTAAAAATASYRYMTVIPIEDDDLTFGGKALSDWHEEDRYRYGSSEDEMRGRTRHRPYEAASSSSGSSSGGGHKHKHHHKKSDKKK